LKIPEKVIPAVDPVKLDNQPANAAQVAADLHYHAGYFLEAQQKPVEAAIHYRDVLQKSPDDARAVAGYGRVQEQLGNTVEASQYLQRACELAPRDPAPFNDLAQFHARQSNLDAAIQYQRQAVSLGPTNQVYRSTLAKFLVDAGRSDEAVQQLAAAHGEAAAHFQVSCLLQDRGQTELARNHLQHSLVLNPNLAPARQMWDRWQAATASSSRLPTTD
jgi:tetratricopeptide (TPR) repeat protein